jgi:3-hydroxyisobutyrate dehydrogenase
VDAVRGAGMVLLAVTAGTSLEAARSCLPGLAKGQLFLDVNSVSPQRKQETAALVAPTGARYVDVAIMTPIAPYAHRAPILCGGPGAREWAPRAQALGMKVEQVSDEVGPAAAIKMFRSIMVKGFEGLMLECMLAASEYGVEERIVAALKESYPGVDWNYFSGYWIERILTHGKRRAEEMREVAETVRACGLEPLMSAATAERHDWLARLGVKLGEKTQDRDQLVAAIRSALGKGPRKQRAA